MRWALSSFFPNYIEPPIAPLDQQRINATVSHNDLVNYLKEVNTQQYPDVINVLRPRIKVIIACNDWFIQLLNGLGNARGPAFLAALGEETQKLISDGQSLYRILYATSDANRLALVSALGKRIVDVIKNDRQLALVLAPLCPRGRTIIMFNLGDKAADLCLNPISVDEDNFFYILKDLNRQEGRDLVTKLQGGIKTLVRHSAQLAQILALFEPSDYLEVLGNVGDEKLDRILKDGECLWRMLENLTLAHRFPLLLILHDRLHKIPMDSAQVYRILRQLEPENCYRVMGLLANKMNDIIGKYQKLDHLCDVIANVPDLLRLQRVAPAWGDSIREIVNSYGAIIMVLKKIGCQFHGGLLTVLGDRVGDCIEDNNQLNHVLRNLHIGNRLELIQTLGPQKLQQLIQSGEELDWILQHLPSEAHPAVREMMPELAEQQEVSINIFF